MIDIEAIINEMTLDEKIAMLAGKDLWHTVPNERLGIPTIKVSDGPNGIRGTMDKLAEPSACTPVGIALGATWNVELIERVGKLLAEELAMKSAHILLAPTVNIHRSPIAGRNFECYSEDPYLSGHIAAAYINGIQKNGGGACIKHFVCNDQEFERNSISSEVTERPLREIYLEPFRLAIRASNPYSVMSAYNKLNGTFLSEHKQMLQNILKNEWAYDGFVMSDWFGTYTPDVPAGGLDLEMPGPARWMAAEHVQAALERGDLSTGELDDKIRRMLRIAERLGAFENPVLAPERGADRLEHRQLLREAAQETIVLLKNENVLPLESSKLKRIAVIGELAYRPNILGGGSSKVVFHHIVSPLAGITERAGESVDVQYAPGCFVHKSLPIIDPASLTTPDGEQGLEIEIFDNLDLSGTPVYEKIVKNTSFGWFFTSVPNANQERFSVRLSGQFTALEDGVHTFGLSGLGQSKLFIDDACVLDHAASDFGHDQKIMKLDMTAGQAYTVRLEFVWEGHPLWRSFHLGCLPPHADNLVAEAVELAKEADAAIVLAGLTEEWESEGYDRVDMKLPAGQDELISAVAAANPNTIVVINAGSAVEMPWINEVKAVVDQWYNGQEVGNSLADVIFGNVNPSGKLPTTFPKRLEDNPSYINFPGENGQVQYGEGLFVGYRYYDMKDMEPLFPFGHGLSYTEFEYGNLRLSNETIKASEGITVSVDISNVGSRPGKEVVQLYVADLQASLARPEKELKAFAKVSLAPDETQTINFHLDQEAFWFYDPARGGWRTEAGEFEILIGASSRDLRLRGTFTLIE